MRFGWERRGVSMLLGRCRILEGEEVYDMIWRVDEMRVFEVTVKKECTYGLG